MANSAGQRLPGQSLTGGQEADEVALLLAEGNRLLLSVDSNISRQRVLPDRYPAFVEFAAHIDLAEEAYALIDLASP